ncbi:MAG: hypothetical protein KC897_09220 [Candidatus Omnitrophica bacterium]|nr:hypothetical protein [Candidatus Omnitrophota bacterium]MCB9721599.1 hypothetical protein [Candidatus Omnitrophota bacterium]
MRTPTVFLLLVLTAAASGCSLYNVTSEETSLNYYPPKDSTQGIVYQEKVDKPHEVIGYVTVNSERRQKIDEIIERMKRETAIMGGDVITNLQSDATGEWKRLPAQDIIGNAYVRANFRATVVILK